MEKMNDMIVKNINIAIEHVIIYNNEPVASNKRHAVKQKKLHDFDPELRKAKYRKKRSTRPIYLQDADFNRLYKQTDLMRFNKPKKKK